MFQLKIELKRVQTFIFEVPRLKAMLGANALIGETMRHTLPGWSRARDWHSSGRGSRSPVSGRSAERDGRSG
jgi:hypothetical protein